MVNCTQAWCLRVVFRFVYEAADGVCHILMSVKPAIFCSSPSLYIWGLSTTALRHIGRSPYSECQPCGRGDGINSSARRSTRGSWLECFEMFRTTRENKACFASADHAAWNASSLNTMPCHLTTLNQAKQLLCNSNAARPSSSHLLNASCTQF